MKHFSYDMKGMNAICEALGMVPNPRQRYGTLCGKHVAVQSVSNTKPTCKVCLKKLAKRVAGRMTRKKTS